MRTKHFMALFITLILCVAGCSVERSLKLDARLPLPPAVKPAPLHIGVYYGPEFIDYTKKIELIGCGPSGRRDRYGIFFIFPVGAASRDLFDQVAAGMFAAVTRVSDPAKPFRDASSLDGLLELRIESFDWGTACTKDYFSTGKFTASVRYVIDLYDSGGSSVASMSVEGLGIEKPRFCLVDCKDSLAAERAMRDAMAKFMVEFNEQPQVREWLLARGAAGGSPK
ncbi:MAG: hypothetical protein KBB65_08560 [Syntrophorhabdaceae bacterium]|nr:hypothetical protein [Syntrophorhabdaceae bacterium]